ncbi:hypothetical protein PCANC_09602 [Puccinia coronata f. sp. avenae]|uniref:HAT C-terminal dimerisation domain-containing protein n=1 Tax=Puccinia coronata f. sp. avenae TaxID=200324 RepID=A0A2N5V9W3_9BASI|nr:hypothetical protein PCANC_09602 [Puccinia coronata f. sp. avenae]
MNTFLEKVCAVILKLWLMYVPAPAPTDAPFKSATNKARPIDEDTCRFLEYMNGSSNGSQPNNNAPGWWKMNQSCFPALSKLASRLFPSSLRTSSKVNKNHYVTMARGLPLGNPWAARKARRPAGLLGRRWAARVRYQTDTGLGRTAI